MITPDRRESRAPFDVVISGGLIVSAEGTFVGDIGVRGQRVAVVGEAGSLTGKTTIDARDKMVVPGGVDPHVHTHLHSGGTVTLDGFAESTRAAAHGGTTTIIDFAIPHRSAPTPLLAVQQCMTDAKDACVDVALHACMTKFTSESLRQIEELAELGLTTLKMFTIYRSEFMLTLEEIRACLEQVNRFGGLALLHCEAPHLVEPLIKRYQERGLLRARYHALSRPPEAELETVRSIIELLRSTGAPGYIVHVSTPEAVLAIVEARASGVHVWAESCPQYVFLNDSVYEGAEGALWICSPPIRGEESRRKLWQLLVEGFIDLWGSDHCCYNRRQKLAFRDDFTRVPNGLPGVETRCPLLFSHGVIGGTLSPSDFVRLTSTNPAKLNGLYPRKGRIAPGSDADIAIYDPSKKRALRAADLHTATDYTPFEGSHLTGGPELVMLRGRIIVSGGRFRGEPGYGEVIASGRPVSPGVAQLALGADPLSLGVARS